MNRPAQVIYTNNTPITPLPIASTGVEQVSIQGASPVNLGSYLSNTTPVPGRIEE